MSDDDFPSAAWTSPTGSSESSPPGGGGFFRSTWRAFRRWPVWGQVLAWVAVAFFALGGIGAATGAGDDDSNDRSTPVVTTAERQRRVDASTGLARGVCLDFGDFLADAGQLGEMPTQAQAQASIDDLGSIAADARQSARENPAYSSLASAVDQLQTGLRDANPTLIEAGSRDAATRCLALFPDLAPPETTTTTTTTTAPPPPPPLPPPPPPPPPQPACDPNYTPCIPPYPPDLDCADVGPVQVIGSDPHGLDADSDGFGCE